MSSDSRSAVQRRAPQLAVGHRAAEHGQRVRLFARHCRRAGRRCRPRSRRAPSGRSARWNSSARSGKSRAPAAASCRCLPGVVAAICPRICRPVRKSLRLKAASASVFSVALGFRHRAGLALDLGLQLDRRILEIVAFEGLVRCLRRDEAERQRCAKCCGANQTNHDGAPWDADRRRVSNRSARKGDGPGTFMAVPGRRGRSGKVSVRHMTKRAPGRHAGSRPWRHIAVAGGQSQRSTARFVARSLKRVRNRAWRRSGFFILAVL